MQVATNTKQSSTCTATIPIIECNETSSLWNFHDNLIALSTIMRDEPGDIDVELRQYLRQSVIPRHNDPLKYWQTLKHAYPVLFNIAIKHLAITATFVPSERLFSKAGIIKSDIRNRLNPTRLTTLLFLGSLNREDWGFI